MPRPHPQVPEGFPQYSLGDLKRMPAHKLLEIAEQLQIHEGVARARKQDVIFALLKVLTRHGEGVAAAGVLHSDAYCLAATADDKEAAWRFIEFANSPAGQTIVARSGRTVPSLVAVAESNASLDPAARPARRSR